MGQNNTGQLRIVTPVVGAASYTFAPTDDTVVVRQIPRGGTTLHLPPGAQSGDRYEFVDGDGSCSTLTPLLVVSPAGISVRGGDFVNFTTPFVNAALVFDEASKGWALLAQGAAGAVVSRLKEFTTDGTFTVPADVTLLTVEGFGGGGGGGQGQAGAMGSVALEGGGGGGGATPFRFALPVAPGDQFQVTLGQGGAGATSGTDGAPGGATSFLDTFEFGLTFPGASGGVSGGAPWVSGGPNVTAQQSNAQQRGTSARGGPGAGGAGGSGMTPTTLANAGADNAGPIINEGVCSGGSPGAPGATAGGNAGGGGGGGGGAGPGGSGGTGGAGGNASASAAGAAGSAGTSAIDNSGAGGGGGGAGGNGTSGGAGGNGGNGGSGFLRVFWTVSA